MSETQTHIAIVDYLRLVLGHPVRVRIWHCPSGGLRTKREAALFRAMGVLPGIPDILIWGPLGKTYAMEVKRPAAKSLFARTKAGTLSAAQKEMRDWMHEMHFPVAVVTSIDDARRAVEEWGLKSREVSMATIAADLGAEPGARHV